MGNDGYLNNNVLGLLYYKYPYAYKIFITYIWQSFFAFNIKLNNSYTDRSTETVFFN